jgi:hypothetical protein
MKKLFLIVLCFAGMLAHAQKVRHGYHIRPSAGPVLAKPTAVGDTVIMTNIPDTSAARLLYGVPGGGYTSGTNVYNDLAFAERYSFSANDSTVSVLGVVALFNGTVMPGSSKSVMLRLWKQGNERPINARLYYEGFPATCVDSLSVPVTALGIGPADTLKTFLFSAPADTFKEPFFVGYSINYNFNTLSGDTVALAMSANGTRHTAAYHLRYNMGTAADTLSIDTMLHVQNATQWTDYGWRDNYTENDSLSNHLAIFPIVRVTPGLGVTAIARGLSLGGVYPNPATTTATIAFTLQQPATTTILVADAAGRIVARSQQYLAAGAQQFVVNTAALAPGSYTYVVQANGAGLAGILQVQH